MDKFDRIIGYDVINKDLRIYCDAFRNLGKYKLLSMLYRWQESIPLASECRCAVRKTVR